MCAHAKNAPVRAEQFPSAMAQIMSPLTLRYPKLRPCAGQLESGQFLLEPLPRS